MGGARASAQRGDPPAQQAAALPGIGLAASRALGRLGITSVGRHNRARTAAETSIGATALATPGWAAVTQALAQAEAPTPRADAAQRALDVLDRVPAARLRGTSRARLTRLDTALNGTPADGVANLHERVRVLAPLIDNHGTPAPDCL
ncbi:hypothetical protein ACFTWD_04575 [Streptomyces sp. NPDC056943]|uniref:hypothetical protein n=1 Tax=Streptomyces sp. NPDC056943 TaxID=3345971 RepID=UPI00362E4904